MEPRFSKQDILEALMETDWNVSRAAVNLKMSRQTMVNYINRYKLSREAGGIMPTKKEIRKLPPVIAEPLSPEGDPLPKADAKRTAKEQLQATFAGLTTDEERILFFARQGVEARDIAATLGLTRKLADAEFKNFFEETVARGLAEMRIEIAQTLITEAKLGQVTALREVARAHLEAYKDAAPSTEFMTGYKAKVMELLEKIFDKRHPHILDRFKFDADPKDEDKDKKK